MQFSQALINDYFKKVTAFKGFQDLVKYTQVFLDENNMDGKKVAPAFFSEILSQLALNRSGLDISKEVVKKFLTAINDSSLKKQIQDDTLLYWVDQEDLSKFRDASWLSKNKVKSEIEKIATETVRAIILNENDEVLLGLNSTNKEYGLPGGHLQPNEIARDAIVRELEEETGFKLESKNLEYLFDIEKEKVYLGKAVHDKRISPSPVMDPDKEFCIFQWFPLKKLPPSLYDCCEEALHRYKRGKIKDDQPQMVWASTTWKDYVQGEYWIVDGDEIFADSDIDVGHEQVATETMLMSHSDEFVELLAEKNIKHEGKEIKEDDLLEAYTFGSIPDDVGLEVMGVEWEDLKKDAREAFMKHYQAIMNINLNFAVWTLTPKEIKAIQNFILDKAEGDMPVGSGEQILIEEASTKRHRDLELDEFLGMKYPGQVWRAPAAISKVQASIESVEEIPGLTVTKIGNKLLTQIKGTEDYEDFKGVINLATKTGHIQSLKSKTNQLAKKILEWFESKARSLGILRIVSETLPNSLDFWKSLGYKVIKRDNHPPIVKKPLGKEESNAASPSTYLAVEDPGVIEIYVDDKLAYTMDDNAIWEVLPRMAQEKAKGKKVTFKQVLPSGEVIDFNSPSPPVPTMAAISPEERKKYTDFGKDLKTKLVKELGVPLRVSVLRSLQPNPWIEVRVADYEKHKIPNEFRKKVVEKLGITGVRDMEDISYGNIQSRSVSLSYNDWLKVME